MKINPVLASILIATSIVGYGLANAQVGMAPPGGGTPGTATNPSIKICGDHPCKPGEVYTPGGAAATNATNGTKAPMSAQINIGANATVIKTANGTMTIPANKTITVPTNRTLTVPTNKTITVPANKTITIPANQTASSNVTSTTVPPPVQAPEKQVASGVAPSAVKCPSGFQLALNKFDSRPACVTPDILAKLVARGWALGTS
ncbi:MAG: hypothetical protein KGI33_11845 [Thaumarchaeota archaeon]|nr:hypothetical protein [Nitrososphaerota archaeon]